MQWRIQRRGPGGRRPLMAEKKFLETAPPPYHRVWMTAPPSPPPPPLISNFYARLASSIEQIKIAYVNFGFHEINM